MTKGVFDDITLKWKSHSYVVRSDRILGAIMRIEDVVTLDELRQYGERNTMPMAKLAAAYASVLRYAGANVSDDEVYAALFGDEDHQQQIVGGITGLLGIMLPKTKMNGDALGKPQGQGQPKAAGALSRKHSRSLLSHGE